jgi:hypothetical protein
MIYYNLLLAGFVVLYFKSFATCTLKLKSLLQVALEQWQILQKNMWLWSLLQCSLRVKQMLLRCLDCTHLPHRLEGHPV